MIYRNIGFDIDWDNGYLFRIYGQPMDCRHETEDSAIAAAKVWIDDLQKLISGGES